MCLDVPVFTTRPQNASVSIGDEVTLQCVAEGPPEPVLTWMGPNRTIISDGVTTGGNLRIYDVAQSDAGEYVCTATNDIGSVTASATITVNGEWTFYSVQTDRRECLHGPVCMTVSYVLNEQQGKVPHFSFV